MKKERNKALDPEPLNREQCKGHAVVPYIQGISEKIKRVLQKHNMKVMEKPIKKLGDMISK